MVGIGSIIITYNATRTRLYTLHIDITCSSRYGFLLGIFFFFIYIPPRKMVDEGHTHNKHIL